MFIDEVSIYIKAGDGGKTRLATGEPVSKASLRVEAYGAVDEANSTIGVARLHTTADPILDPILDRAQNDLFDLGADLATPHSDDLKFEPLRIKASQVDRLEAEVDQLNQKLTPLNSFILPGGTAWDRGEIDPVSATLRRLHADGTTIGALCSGVLALAYAGLVDTRRHTGNYAGHIETYVPDYAGGAHYDADALALTDDGVITAGGVSGIEFAREVIRALALYDERDTEAWYRLFKHAIPPPWFVVAPDEAMA